MIPPVRLIATDLDGTLLGPDERISERTLAALAAARRAGVHVVAATGRSHRTAVPLVGPSGHIDVAICSNGATVYDVVGDRVVEQHPVTAEAAAGMFAAIGDRVPGASFGWESVDGFGWSAGFLDAEPEVGATIRAVAGAAGPRRGDGVALLKVFVAHPDITHDALLAAVAAALPPGLTVTHSGARSVEIMAGGVDKAAALARVCARFGIGADEVVAFGDNQNDLEMLRWAGRGVAMGNAHPAVLAEFSERAGHHADDGVAIAIELLLAAALEAGS